MDATVESERSRQAGQNLAQVVERFSVWRASRAAGGRIPPELWALAVDMARVHGLYRISKELRLDYSGLKRRLEGVGGDVQPGRADTRFVELVAAQACGTTSLRECVIELHNGRGATMRVELNGAGLASLAGLCSGFLSAP
jgi:hypothetical protein